MEYIDDKSVCVEMMLSSVETLTTAVGLKASRLSNWAYNKWKYETNRTHAMLRVRFSWRHFEQLLWEWIWHRAIDCTSIFVWLGWGRWKNCTPEKKRTNWNNCGMRPSHASVFVVVLHTWVTQTSAFDSINLNFSLIYLILPCAIEPKKYELPVSKQREREKRTLT